MSRAFVKDDDDRPEPEFQRPRTDAPNYVTRRGLKLLHEALERARASGDDRNVRYFEERIASAMFAEPPKDRTRVTFGATVRARDAKGQMLTLRIVGEDEAEPARGSVSWQSPIAQAFEGHAAGDRVAFDRPAGPIDYTIDSVEYTDG